MLRDIQGMYAPPPLGNEKRVFWAFVRIAFVISACVLWYAAFGSMKGREADLHKTQGDLELEKRAKDSLQSQLNILTGTERADSLRRRTKKLADDIHFFLQERDSSHPPHSDGRADAVGEQARVNEVSQDYDVETDRLCLAKFGDRIQGIPRELAAKGVPVQHLDQLSVEAGNLRCLYEQDLDMLRGLSYRLDGQDQLVTF